MRYVGQLPTTCRLALSVPTLSFAIAFPTPRRGRVAASIGPQSVSECFLGAAALAVNLTTVAGAADDDLAAAPCAQEEAGGRGGLKRGHDKDLPKRRAWVQPGSSCRCPGVPRHSSLPRSRPAGGRAC